MRSSLVSQSLVLAFGRLGACHAPSSCAFLLLQVDEDEDVYEGAAAPWPSALRQVS
jgi:hypothetical protein